MGCARTVIAHEGAILKDLLNQEEKHEHISRIERHAFDDRPP
jgi:hypothetical protein